MPANFAARFDAHSEWRSALARDVAAFGRWLAEHDLLDPADQPRLTSLDERLRADRLTVAFVAEFSRGKSELINAIFFGDSGRRMLPATPGRTTMCPVELFYDAALPPSIRLLPIETRLTGLSLAELRGRDEPWQTLPLDTSRPAALAETLGTVTRTQRVPIETAQRLGLWNPERPDDNPMPDGQGNVEVPAWRHALINLPHPLLQRGLSVLDTPGLNAIGAEPELTLSLLPAAHAVVFILGADTGVTRSDLAVWREHLAGLGLERLAVLNKIDALADPLLDPVVVAAQIERQRRDTARTLELPPERVFPLSARQALAARLGGDDGGVQASRLPPLEEALAGQLLPRQAAMLVEAAERTVQQLQMVAVARLADQRRQNAEQMLELRGLRGKSGGKVKLMLQRVQAESAEFEQCVARIGALRAVHDKQHKQMLDALSSDMLRSEVGAMHTAAGSGWFGLGAGSAFKTLFERLAQSLDRAEAGATELRGLLTASFERLNAEYGFAFAASKPPVLNAARRQLAEIEAGYSRYVGVAQAWRLAAPGFGEQFRRMLLARLRVVFENAATEVELWCKAAITQMDQQLRDRRKAFARRREALQRIESATDELERRIDELEAGELQLKALQTQLGQAVAAALAVGRPPTGARTLHADAA